MPARSSSNQKQSCACPRGPALSQQHHARSEAEWRRWLPGMGDGSSTQLTGLPSLSYFRLSLKRPPEKKFRPRKAAQCRGVRPRASASAGSAWRFDAVFRCFPCSQGRQGRLGLGLSASLLCTSLLVASWDFNA